ncbi:MULTISPECIES: hypothetical protein [Bacillaceae]|nr:MULTISPECIES: hypothetical protein [Bacillaceae]
MSEKEEKYNEVFEKNVKQIQVEKNKKLEEIAGVPDQQNRLKTVENRRM